MIPAREKKVLAQPYQPSRPEVSSYFLYLFIRKVDFGTCFSLQKSIRIDFGDTDEERMADLIGDVSV